MHSLHNHTAQLIQPAPKFKLCGNFTINKIIFILLLLLLFYIDLLDKKPQKNDLHRLFKSSSARYSTIGTALDVQVDDLLHSSMSASDKLILVFQRWIDSDNDVTWGKVLQVYEDFPEELGQAKAEVKAFLSSDRAHSKYGNNTTNIKL